MLGPTGQVPEVQARLGTEVVRVLRDAEFARGVEGSVMRVDPGTTVELAALIERDIQRWGTLVRSSGARGLRAPARLLTTAVLIASCRLFSPEVPSESIRPARPM
ncbi:MAG: hypothetical protein JNM79_07505 [Burkholderiales bacterium]|nr:hypothetical protein [Burkholderiales bacterium]